MPKLYLFSTDRLGDSVIHAVPNTINPSVSPSYCPVAYTTATTRIGETTSKRNLTRFTGASGEEIGSIDWAPGIFALKGETAQLADIRGKRVGGSDSTTVEWTWRGQYYHVELLNGLWKARRAVDPKSTPLIIFHPVEPRTFRKDIPAHFILDDTLSEKDNVDFLVMVLMWCEQLKRDKMGESLITGVVGAVVNGTWS